MWTEQLRDRSDEGSKLPLCDDQQVRVSRAVAVFPFKKWDRFPFIHRYPRFLKSESRASCDLTIAIKPEKWRETNWTKVSIDVSSDGRH